VATLRSGPALPLLAASLALLGHAALCGAWLPDEAGVALAYARSLAEGRGLVAQPGAPPVEGFASPLWALLLALGHAAGAAALPWAPKAAALAGALLALALVSRAGRPRTTAEAWRATLPAGLLALNSSFALDTASGLEHGLLAALGALSAILAARAGSPGRAAASGLVAALLALTRAEAVFFAAIPPLLWAARRGASGPPLGRRTAAYAAGLLPPVCAWQAVRLWYFGEAVPNALRAAALATPPAAERFRALLSEAAGPFGAALLAVALVGVVGLARRGLLTALRLSIALHLAAAGVAVAALPARGPGSGPLFTLFYYWLLAEVLEGLWVERPRATPAQRRFAATVAVLSLLPSGLAHQARSRALAAELPEPLERGAALARGCARVAARLGLREATLLTPDAGGALLAGGVRVVDALGRCDAALARSREGTAAADYVFGTLRPDFLHVRSEVRWARLREDARFARDYVALAEAPQASSSPPGAPLWGVYVRRDALGGSSPDALREALLSAALPSFSGSGQSGNTMSVGPSAQ
jgi:hypothetical protein